MKSVDNLPLSRLLAERLRQPLPGRAAQGLCEPDLAYGRHFDRPPPDARPAAVMLLLYQSGGRWHLPLVLRPTTMADHAGQVGLPGGLVEPGETAGEAARRELAEELGVSAGVELLGTLTPLFLFVSNYRVTPWVGAVADRPRFRPSEREVARLVELPLAALLDGENLRRQRRQERGLVFTAPVWDCADCAIWGATAMILAELVAILREWAG